MAPESGKVTRRLTIKIQPMRGRKWSVTVNDGTTRSEEGKRHVEGEIVADTWSYESASDSFEHVLKAFEKSLKDEDPGELFADEKTPKPKIDK
jgi:hypothetical protein